MSTEPRRPRRTRLAALRRRPWLVVLGSALGIGGGLTAAALVPARYLAAAVLSLELDSATAARLTPETAAERLRLRLPGLRDRLEAARIADGLELSATGGDRLQVGCASGSPERAAQLANRLADVLAAPVGGPAVPAKTDPAVLEQQVAAARRALEQNDARIKHLSAPTDDAERGARDAAELERLRSERALVATELGRARERRDAPPREPAPAAQPDPELTRLRRQLEALRTRYTDQHPDVLAVLRRIAEIEATGQGAAPAAPLGGAAAAAPEAQRHAAEVASLEARLAELDREIARRAHPTPASGTAEHRRQLALLTREQERLQGALLALATLQQAQQDALLAERTRPAEVFRIVEPARPPQRPFYPSVPVFASFGLVTGLLAGVAAAFVAEARDGSVRNAEELERLLGRPLLAAIPFVTSRERREHDGR
jgi:uncharacterized protein involved in exopolysaccharide biosynthesis